MAQSDGPTEDSLEISLTLLALAYQRHYRCSEADALLRLQDDVADRLVDADDIQRAKVDNA